MKKLKPLAGYCLIEPIDEEQTTVSGLVMPDKEKEKPSKGKVIAVGDPIIHYEGQFREVYARHREYSFNVTESSIGSTDPYIKLGGFPQEVCQVKKGDIVTYHKWAGQDVKEGQKEYRLVKFQDLMAVYG